MDKSYADFTDVSTTRKVFPVEKTALVKRVHDEAMTEGLLYRAQLAVFNAKMDLLNFILENDMVPVDDELIDIEIRVSRRAVSSEATDGKWINLPADMHHLTTLVYSSVGLSP